MKAGKLDEKTYLIRMERGEDFMTSLKSFCHNHAIKNAFISGIGSLSNPTVAHYDINAKEYKEKKLEGVFELTSLIGNVAICEQDIVIHCHVTLADANMQSFGGHLINGTIGATAELTVTVYPKHYDKTVDEATGVKLFDLPKED